MKIQDVIEQARSLWPDISINLNTYPGSAEFQCGYEQIPPVCDWLFHQKGYCFAGLIVEENNRQWDLYYLFTGRREQGCILARVSAPVEERAFKSVSRYVHAADWHEREAEDLFGVTFEGHPRLGDFILHDDVWEEGVEPMRRGFDPKAVISMRKSRPDWRPKRILTAPGAFIMPVGPVFSGEAESVHFQLETIGEEILCVFPRLFFKYRGVEKAAEGRMYSDVLLLSERFAGTTAFSHALAFCMAVERLCDVTVPERAQVLRVFFAELERFRSHLGTIEAVCNSTGLVVAANQMAILEEEALRLSGALSGHRYLFGLAVPGGFSQDVDDTACKQGLIKLQEIVRIVDGIEKLLSNTSSFLDRIEEVGIVTGDQAENYGMVGPVARGSKCNNDLRFLQPYCMYDKVDFDVPCEKEGDGYARLRILFAELRESFHIMEQAVDMLSKGDIVSPCEIRPGVSFAGVETPRGASWHWVRINEEGKIDRYRIISPSFANWHGFHFASENFAFQDFPIILATFGLSVAENDR